MCGVQLKGGCVGTGEDVRLESRDGTHACPIVLTEGRVVQKANKNKEALWVGIGIQPLVYVHPVRIFEFTRLSGYKNNTEFVVLYYIAANILNNTNKVFSNNFY